MNDLDEKPGPPPAVLTIGMEDYFHVAAFGNIVSPRRWYRFESRVEHHAHRTLNLLAEYDQKATFFVMGSIAERFPTLIREIRAAGHEVASRGETSADTLSLTDPALRYEIAHSKATIENIIGQKVNGFRAGGPWLKAPDLRLYRHLADTGYTYDSSTVGCRGQARHGVLSLGVTAGRVWGKTIPAGGNYLRQLPDSLFASMLDRNGTADPLVLYFHTWELDPDQPRLTAANRWQRLRHYRNLHRMEAKLRLLLGRYRFTTAADFLGLPVEAVEATRPQSHIETVADVHTRRTPVSVVIPCFNEEKSLPYLKNTLEQACKILRQKYEPEFVLVDDGSSDKTWETMHAVFGEAPGFRLVRHPGNLGIAAAIQTGIRAARTEIVASIDSDCSYDPSDLSAMIDMLDEDTAIVAASPYHPLGSVLNVPRYRLMLSRGASAMYHHLFRQKLHTYTSCCRVYRKSLVENVTLRHGNFLGIVELMYRVDRAGGTIREYPATLESRLFGASSMKTLRVIRGHLKMMAGFMLEPRTKAEPGPRSALPTPTPTPTR